MSPNLFNLPTLENLRRYMDDSIVLGDEDKEMNLRRLRLLTLPGNPMEGSYDPLGISGCPHCGGSGWVSTRRPSEEWMIWPGHGWSLCGCAITAHEKFMARTRR